MINLIVKGQIIHCDSPFNLKVYEQGFIIINDNGKIIALDTIANLPTTIKVLKIHDYTELTLKNSQLLIPGFIDTHTHAPQYPNIGLGYDKTLIDWLQHYTFPLEKTLKDKATCESVFDSMVKRSLDYGITTACYFGSLFKEATIALADAVISNGQRAFIGKINMTQSTDSEYVETPEESLKRTVECIEEIKLKGGHLVQPIITPRFAVSVNMKIMKQLAEIAKKLDLNIQTHIAENPEELKIISALYPDCDSYTDVYDRANLLTPKTVLAHGIHLNDKELEIIAERKAAISHCPDSNTNLKSGLCDVRRLINKGITVGLGTDISGGSTPSMLSVMKQALAVSIHLSFIKGDGYKTLDYKDVFYLATLGGAKALALDDITGNFQIGKSFDGLIVDLNMPHNSGDYFEHLDPLQLLQKLIFTGDDRNIITVFVDGKAVKNG